MEDLAASLMSMSSFSHRHSAPLYLLYSVSSFPKDHAALPLGHDVGGGGGGFEFSCATMGKREEQQGGGAELRACASDVSAAFADELFREGVLLPLKLPPRLQRPSLSAAASTATSPTALGARGALPSSRSPFGARYRRHDKGFDPFAAALEKVRRDAPMMRRARSLSPLRGHRDVVVPRTVPSASGADDVAARQPWRGRRRGGVKRLLCGVVVASPATAAVPRTRRKGDGVSYRRGLLVCFGF